MQAGKRGRTLVQQILAFSRTQEQPRRHLRLELVVAEAVKLLRATIPSTIELELLIALDLPAVLADVTQIHQVVMNLCTNSAHAMRDRPGLLTVALPPVIVDDAIAATNPGLKPGPHVRLSVKDTGCGMDAAVLARIFEPFSPPRVRVRAAVSAWPWSTASSRATPVPSWWRASPTLAR
jgi:signal transduction histidine kinase